MDVRVGLWRKLSVEELKLLNCGVGEDSWESLGLQGEPTSPSWRRSVLGVHWKDWCWSWNSNTLTTSCEELTHWKGPWCWKDWGQEEKGMTEDEMAGWHHWLDGHGFESTPGVGDGQGGLACCDSWGRKESDTTERLNWTEYLVIIAIRKWGKASSTVYLSIHLAINCNQTEIAHLGLPEASKSVFFCVCFFKKVGKVTFINYCHLQFINSIVKLKNKTNKPWGKLNSI